MYGLEFFIFRCFIPLDQINFIKTDINRLRKESYIIEKIKLLILDCDGVLTDGKFYYTKNGKLLLTFSAKDSLAVSLIRDYPLLIERFIIITSANDPSIVMGRAKELGVECYHAKPMHKAEVLSEIVNLKEVAYIGDSLDDLQVFAKVGHSFAPADAADLVKRRAVYNLNTKGGEGCVLEALVSLLPNLMRTISND